MFVVSCTIYSLRLGAGLLGTDQAVLQQKVIRSQGKSTMIMFMINTAATNCKLVFNMINYKNSTYQKCFLK